MSTTIFRRRLKPPASTRKAPISLLSNGTGTTTVVYAAGTASFTTNGATTTLTGSSWPIIGNVSLSGSSLNIAYTPTPLNLHGGAITGPVISSTSSVTGTAAGTLGLSGSGTILVIGTAGTWGPINTGH